MKLIIFAGGSGRRLWPISRQKSPKQFEPIIGDKSTLQLAFERVEPLYGAENIFISTNQKYVDIIRQQIPQMPAQNVIGEPMRRDLAAAVGLAVTHLSNATPDEQIEEETIAILWGDNYMENVGIFREVLQKAENLLNQKKADILFMGETPRFANNNLGWIGLGEKKGEVNGRSYYGFNSLTYRPPLAECQEMFKNQTHVWNTGYFVTTLGFVRQQYAKHTPEMWQKLSQIETTIGTDAYEETLQTYYPQLDEISFDDAILTHINPTRALVLHGEMGWSDPGTLYALKEAVAPDEMSNAVQGLVIDKDSKDCLIYNYEDDKLVAAVGLEGMVVVNTKDAVLVVHKDQIPLVKKLVNEFEGTELESYS